MGVHKLTTNDLEALGRWKSKVNDPSSCPEYMVRTAKSKRTTKTKTTTKSSKASKASAKKREEIQEVEEPTHSEEMVS